MKIRAHLLAASLVFAAASAASGQLFLVGRAPGNEQSRGYGLSADGSVSVGFSLSETGARQPAYIWTRATGRRDFGLEPGMPFGSFAYGVSGNGQVVVGEAAGAFRYSGPGTIQNLGIQVPYQRSAGLDASFDGSVVVGRSWSTVGGIEIGQGFRWTQAGGLQPLGFTRPGHTRSDATAVSADGNTLVGWSHPAGGSSDAFVWTTTGGFSILPHAPGTGPSGSFALAMNSTGSVVVGVSGPSQTMTIWRDGLVTNLGRPPGIGATFARAVNDGGDVVAGQLVANTGQVTAGVWTPARGMEPLEQYLAANGVIIPLDVSLNDCTAVSADGLTFTGIATDLNFTQGFVVTIPGSGSLIVLLASCVFLPRRRRENSLLV